MQIYFLATTLFAVTALLLITGNEVEASRKQRVLPFYLLVISRLLALIIALTAEQAGQFALESLEVFSIFCIIWMLMGPLSNLSPVLLRLMWAGAGVALVLSLLPLFPAWPIPYQIHGLIISIFSPVILIASWQRPRITHLAPPLLLALTTFLGVFQFTSLIWFTALFAYAFLLYAVYRDLLNIHRRIYADRQQSARTMVQETQSANQEQQRLLQITKILTAVTDLSVSNEHLVRSLVGILQVDQAVIFSLDTQNPNQARLISIYSSEHSDSISVSLPEEDVSVLLDDYSSLNEAMQTRTQLIFSKEEASALSPLYRMWYEDRVGPTLIQPLSVHGQSVGLLVLGNPVSRRPIRVGDARLSEALSGQIAAMVEYSRQYHEVKQLQVEQPVEVGPAAPVAPPMPVPAMPSAPRSAEIEAYLAIFQTINDGVVVSDSRGRVRWANPAVETILHLRRDEIIGQPIAAIYGEIDSGEPIEDLIVSFSRRNKPLPTFIENDSQAIQGRLIPWRNENHEWMGIIAVFRDVTREVKADQARSDFIAALSRELRAPLTAVKGYSELITNGVMNGYSSEQLRVQQIIHSSAERMVRVLDNAIQITSANRHQVLPRFEEVNPTAIINEALRGIKTLAQLRDLTLKTDIHPKLPAIVADARHVRRIVDNLLSNACRFTPPGGQITLQAQPTSDRDGNKFLPRVHIAVIDTGVGISLSETKRIFDPFYQVQNSLLGEETGMGMGLTVAKELVQLHKGRIWVEAKLNEGAAFHVVLPVTQEY